MSEFQQVNKVGVTRDLTPEAVVIWGTDGLPMGSAANPIFVSDSPGAVGTPTSRSGTITTGGTAQSLLSTSTTRITFFVSNPDATNDLWIALHGVTALANGIGSIRIPANGGGIGFVLPDPVRTAVSVVGVVTGQKFTAWET